MALLLIFLFSRKSQINFAATEKIELQLEDFTLEEMEALYRP
jgi:hypothetical protein